MMHHLSDKGKNLTELNKTKMLYSFLNPILQFKLKHENHQNRSWFLYDYWPYSWLSPHSLILLASCWAFFFSRQALQTEEKDSVVILWNRKLCSGIPVLHMTLLLSGLAHTETSWMAMSGGCISKLWGRLTTVLPRLLHSSGTIWHHDSEGIRPVWFLSIRSWNKAAENEYINTY